MKDKRTFWMGVASGIAIAAIFIMANEQLGIPNLILGLAGYVIALMIIVVPKLRNQAPAQKT